MFRYNVICMRGPYKVEFEIDSEYDSPRGLYGYAQMFGLTRVATGAWYPASSITCIVPLSDSTKEDV